MGGKRWTEKEKEFLISNYGDMDTKKIAEKLDRSDQAVYAKAAKLDLESERGKLRDYWKDKQAVMSEKLKERIESLNSLSPDNKILEDLKEFIKDPTVEIFTKIRCPNCGNWITTKSNWGNVVKMVCLYCGERFQRKEGGFMDGIFLEDVPISERYNEYIKEGVKQLGLSQEVRERSKEIIAEVDTSGKNPRVMAGCAVYLSTIEIDPYNRTTQEKIANIFNISQGAIRNNYPYLIENSSLKVEI